jgi:K+/H+ antiporter YhaU regulatory subunit KhtT
MEPDSSLDFVVEDLPRIGRSYQMTGTNGGRITVVIHHSGRRVVHGLNVGADQASAVELSDQQARKLGAILAGAFFKPAVVEEVEAVFEDLLIDWVALEPTSPGVDKSIAELEMRRTTGGDHHCDHPRRSGDHCSRAVRDHACWRPPRRRQPAPGHRSVP